MIGVLGIDPRVIAQEVLVKLIFNICSEIALLKLLPHRPVVIEIMFPILAASVKCIV